MDHPTPVSPSQGPWGPEKGRAEIRAAFWIIGLLSGILLCYGTRHYINGDAVAYIEMGRALRNGNLWGLANLTYSPGYPVLLGLAQAILDTDPLNELQYLRIVNFFCFVLGMIACEALLTVVRRDHIREDPGGARRPLPFEIVRALTYGMFLICALLLVRVRLMTPDMLILAILIWATTAVLWIKEDPGRYSRFLVLGAILGVGYLVKSFMFPFSAVFFGLAALVSGSWRRAVPRVLAAVSVMLIVGAPLMGALSYRMGRFSYGELGGLAYGLWISGEGEPINKPEALNEKPRVVVYRYAVPCTQPSGHDICYWYVGFGPKPDLRAHFKVITENIAGLLQQTPWLVLLLIWFLFLRLRGSFRWGRPVNPSQSAVLLIIGAAGIGFFCLLHMEPRYVAPFFFLGFVGLAGGLRCSPRDPAALRRIRIASAGLMLFFSVLLVHSLVDQSLSGLGSPRGKLSYRDAFREHVAVKNFLEKHGTRRGSEVAVLGRRPPIYWARMAGVTIVGEVTDPDEFFHSTPLERAHAVEALSRADIKALVGKDPRLNALAGEGWTLVPGTRDYYALSIPRARP
jgi:hypothetical protein